MPSELVGLIVLIGALAFSVLTYWLPSEKLRLRIKKIPFNVKVVHLLIASWLASVLSLIALLIILEGIAL